MSNSVKIVLRIFLNAIFIWVFSEIIFHLADYLKIILKIREATNSGIIPIIFMVFIVPLISVSIICFINGITKKLNYLQLVFSLLIFILFEFLRMFSLPYSVTHNYFIHKIISFGCLIFAGWIFFKVGNCFSSYISKKS